MRDQVVSKSAYLETLVAMGITVESAYQSLKNRDPNAWKIIQKIYQPGMSNAINHIKSYDNTCKAKLYENTEVNVNRMLH